MSQFSISYRDIYRNSTGYEDFSSCGILLALDMMPIPLEIFFYVCNMVTH